MSICQSIKLDGQKCTRQTSNKLDHNPLYCWQHRKSQNQKGGKGQKNDELCCQCTGKKYIQPIPTYPIGKKGLPYSKWYEVSRRYWMTIGDLLKVKIGQPIKVLSLHRNILDIVTSTNDENVSYSPIEFFKTEIMYWTRKKDIFGKLVVQYEGQEDVIYENSGFDLYLHDQCMWYPLEGVHDKNYKIYKKISGDLTGANCLPGEMGPDNCKSWKEYPLSTYVGWRGPIIRWENLSKLPPLYFTWASDGYSVL